MKQAQTGKTRSQVARALGTRPDRIEILKETECQITVKQKFKNNTIRYQLMRDRGIITAVLRIV